jgi:hypothetical protein
MDAGESPHIDRLLKRVEHLHLKELQFPWSSLLYHDLVSLHLHSRSAYPNSIQWNTILQACLRLQSLVLLETGLIPLGANERNIDAALKLQPRIRLPQLRLLRTGPNSYLCSWLLSRIEAPVLEFISIAIERDNRHGANNSAALLECLYDLLVRRQTTCPLTRIHVGDIQAIPRAFLELVRAATLLWKARFTRCSGPILRVMIDEPHIQSFRFDNVEDVDAGTLAELLALRHEKDFPLLEEPSVAVNDRQAGIERIKLEKGLAHLVKRFLVVEEGRVPTPEYYVDFFPANPNQ